MAQAVLTVRRRGTVRKPMNLTVIIVVMVKRIIKSRSAAVPASSGQRERTPISLCGSWREKRRARACMK